MKNDFTIGEITKCKEDEIKPCPFCGGKEIVIDKYEHQAGERAEITFIRDGKEKTVHVTLQKSID